MNRKYLLTGVAIIIIGILVVSILNTNGDSLRLTSDVSIDDIETFMEEQVALGPRHPGSEGSLAFKDWLFTKIPTGWSIEVQNFTFMDVELRNYLITSSNTDQWPTYLIGAHYDTRIYADQSDEFENRDDPVPGANDAASGVAVILEMFDHIPEEFKDKMGFVLFDGEDQGGAISGWDYIEGSRYFVNQMTETEVNQTAFFLLFDMIADDELVLKYERSSDDELNEMIWNKAHDLGYDTIFQKVDGYRITDDHRPFLDRGIRAVDLIDLDYPEWHTIEDTMENVSPENAAIVLDVIIEWFKQDFWVSNPVIGPDSDISKTDESYFPQMGLTLVVITLIVHFNRKYSRKI